MRRGATRSRRRSRPNRFSSCKVSKWAHKRARARMCAAVSFCVCCGLLTCLFVYVCLQLSWGSCRLTWRLWGSSGRTPSPPPERSCTRPRRRYCHSNLLVLPHGQTSVLVLPFREVPLVKKDHWVRLMYLLWVDGCSCKRNTLWRTNRLVY